jgi:hypothetical protein
MMMNVAFVFSSCRDNFLANYKFDEPSTKIFGWFHTTQKTAATQHSMSEPVPVPPPTEVDINNNNESPPTTTNKNLDVSNMSTDEVVVEASIEEYPAPPQQQHEVNEVPPPPSSSSANNNNYGSTGNDNDNLTDNYNNDDNINANDDYQNAGSPTSRQENDDKRYSQSPEREESEKGEGRPKSYDERRSTDRSSEGRNEDNYSDNRNRGNFRRNNRYHNNNNNIRRFNNPNNAGGNYGNRRYDDNRVNNNNNRPIDDNVPVDQRKRDYGTMREDDSSQQQQRERSPKRMRRSNSPSGGGVAGGRSYSANPQNTTYQNRYQQNRPYNRGYNNQQQQQQQQRRDNRSPPRTYTNQQNQMGGNRPYNQDNRVGYNRDNRFDNNRPGYVNRDNMPYNRGGYNDRRYPRNDGWRNNAGAGGFQDNYNQMGNSGPNRPWTDRPGGNYDRNGPRRYDNYNQGGQPWQNRQDNISGGFDNRRTGHFDRRGGDSRGFNRDAPPSTWTPGAPAYNQPSGRQGFAEPMASGRSDPYINRDQQAGPFNQQQQSRYPEEGRYPTDNTTKYNSSGYEGNPPNFQATNYVQRHEQYSSNASRDGYSEHMKQSQPPVVQQQLPPDWQEYVTEDNKKYYYNTRTKTSQWDIPK